MGTQQSQRAMEPALLSWQWLLSQAPTGAISVCGRAFPWWQSQGLRQGFRRGQGPLGPFSFVLGTLGLCSRLALFENGTRIMGGVWTWVRDPLTPEVLNRTGGRGRIRDEPHFWARHPLEEPSSHRGYLPLRG